MGGNVWEYTSSNSSIDSYYKTGGAFDSSEENLVIGFTAYTLWEQLSGNTGFRCITNDINHNSAEPAGCIDINSCNYDDFALISEECYINDCLLICGGNTQEYEFYQDLDQDGLGNPEISEF